LVPECGRINPSVQANNGIILQLGIQCLAD